MAAISNNGQGLRIAADGGIAIGPILFIIAILGILAAAISAGSGSFSTGTKGESNKAKAAALIDIGQNLKIGFERIVADDVEFASVNIDPADTSADSDLFAPSGGGITPPSITMSATGSDPWYYPLIDFPGIGSGDGNRVAIISVTDQVCDVINDKANGLAATPAAFDINDLTVDTGATPVNGSTWPATLQGKLTGCIHVNAQGTMVASYFFYQVMGIQ